MSGLIENNRLGFLPASSPVLILGMHRSGTSLLTRILAESGLYLGKDLDRNHESKTFKRINEYLINSTGGNWDYPKSVEVLEKDNELRSLYLQYVRRQLVSPRCFGYFGAKNLITQNKLPMLWGWKDPRNSFTLNFWGEIYPDCKVVVIERHGLDVASSLMRRRTQYLAENKRKLSRMDFLYYMLGKRGSFVDTARVRSLTEGVKLWSEYTQKARESSVKVSSGYRILKFEEFLDNPIVCITGVLEFLEVDVDMKLLRKACLKIDASRAYAYRNNGVLDLLTSNEKSIIEALLTPFGYSLE